MRKERGWKEEEQGEEGNEEEGRKDRGEEPSLRRQSGGRGDAKETDRVNKGEAGKKM